MARWSSGLGVGKKLWPFALTHSCPEPLLLLVAHFRRPKRSTATSFPDQTCISMFLLLWRFLISSFIGLCGISWAFRGTIWLAPISARRSRNEGSIDSQAFWPPSVMQNRMDRCRTNPLSPLDPMTRNISPFFNLLFHVLHVFRGQVVRTDGYLWVTIAYAWISRTTEA